MAFIQASLLTKRYGQLTALDGCSLEAPRGEILGLLGPNGSGKTTLLRLLLGFIKPTSGQASIDGLDCYRQSVEVHRRSSYLPGEPRLFRKLTGRQVLQFFSQLRTSMSAKSVADLVDRLELDESRQVQLMSTGMRQKLVLAAVLAPDVPLVVLDEPTSNLDPTTRGGVLQLLQEAKDSGKTIIFSSHVLSEVEEICDRVVLLREGHVVETLRMDQMRRQHRIRAQLTGRLTQPEGALAGNLQIDQDEHQSVTILTGQPLEPLLGWLAAQPLTELRIEPVGLRAVYERYHPPSES